MIIGFILALMARLRGGVMMHGAFSAFPDTLAQLSWSTFNIDLDVINWDRGCWEVKARSMLLRVVLPLKQ